MKRKTIFSAFTFLLLSSLCFAQTAFIEGYTFETDNRGYVKNVIVKVLHKRTGEMITQVKTNKDGYFLAEVPKSKEYTLVVNKRMFLTKEVDVTTVGLAEDEKSFIKIEMERKPGYIFDVTIAESGKKGQAQVDAIAGARIEVYNNTTRKLEMELNDFPYPTFNFGFEKGNHYTIMIRKKGYLTKRIEAYVNVEDCILCFEGLGTLAPEVTDVLTQGHETGTFLANVGLEKAEINKTFTINNIYYDYDKWNIREDAANILDGLITVLKDNPGVTIELGAHTDSRGSDSYNMKLSEKRAESAVNYILASGLIDYDKLTSKGYGESELTNRCDDGVACSEAEHQENRRTELKIVGIEEEDPLDKKTLKEIIEEEKLMREVMNSKEIKK